MNAQLITIIKSEAEKFGLDWKAIAAFITVETGGLGFDSKTGKIIIQFEPSWFRKKAPYAPSGKWSLNGVERQAAEWIAFNDAFGKNNTAAMQSTSIGLGQIMGFHYARLGFDNVGEMWDAAKRGLECQVWQICKFIITDPNLKNALQNKDWDKVAANYNGAGYKKLAAKIGREPYDISMRKAYESWKS